MWLSWGNPRVADLSPTAANKQPDGADPQQADAGRLGGDDHAELAVRFTPGTVRGGQILEQVGEGQARHRDPAQVLSAGHGGGEERVGYLAAGAVLAVGVIPGRPVPAVARPVGAGGVGTGEDLEGRDQLEGVKPGDDIRVGTHTE